MKNLSILLIVLCSAVIGFVYLNYPFKTERFSYYLVFICLAVIVFTVVKHKYKDDGPKTYEETEKKQDEIYKKDGIFKYVNDGFYITKNHSMEYIKWNDITEINKFLISVGKSSQGGLEVVTKDKSIEIYSSNSPGFEKFTLQINKNLDIDPSWTVDYTVSAHQIVKPGLFKDRVYLKTDYV